MKKMFLNWWNAKRDLKFKVENLNSLLKAERAYASRLELKVKSSSNETIELQRTILKAAELMNEKNAKINTLNTEVAELKIKNVFLKNDIK